MQDDRPAAPTIARERPDSPDAVLLVTELEAYLEPLYPIESRHGLSIERLLNEGVAFFVLRWHGTPAGCGGVKIFDGDYGEVKRMYVRPQYRGLGFAKMLLRRLEDYTREQAVHLLRLETGVHQREAIELYERMGFHRIPPFGSYTDDPLSLCYEKAID